MRRTGLCKLTQKGDTVFGKVHNSPDSRGNILSFGTTRDRCHHAEYDFDTDTYKIKMVKGGVVYVFVRWKNIYVHDTRDPGHTLGSDHLSIQSVVRPNAAKYTKREVKQVATAITCSP
jgi:hypothetical protein